MERMTYEAKEISTSPYSIKRAESPRPRMAVKQGKNSLLHNNNFFLSGRTEFPHMDVKSANRPMDRQWGPSIPLSGKGVIRPSGRKGGRV